MRQASRERGGAAIAARLRERRGEIEQATLTRVYAVSEPPAGAGPEYLEGLRVAVSAAVEYGLGGIERGERHTPPVPEVLLAQAHLAARSGVSLDTVLRRYFAGHTLIDDFMVEEAEREQLDPAELKRLLRSQAAIVDRLLAAVSDAYNEETERRPQSPERRRAELVARLLAGEPLETRELAYDFDGHHLGCVLSGPEAARALTQIAKPLDARLLSARREEGTLWAWLGSRRPLDPGELQDRAARELPEGHALAIGEPGEGISGWRLTHRQARAALPVARRGGRGVVRYADVALEASMLQDDLLVASLRRLYLEPLEAGRDGGEVDRETLRAYFAAERNVSSTATALGVNRNTVSSRLRAIEKRLTRPLVACATDLEVALRLEELDDPPHVTISRQVAQFPPRR